MLKLSPTGVVILAVLLEHIVQAEVAPDDPSLLTLEEECQPKNAANFALKVNFSEGFQVHNNLGGLGPITSHPDSIRYASIAGGAAPPLPDQMFAMFCGDIPLHFRHTLYRWPDETPRACDPFESVRNYVQTAPYTSRDVVQEHAAQLAAVAWSGRIADTPSDAQGRLLNLGVLPGTNDSHVEGHPVGEPGAMPGVLGLHVEQYEQYPSDWT